MEICTELTSSKRRQLIANWLGGTYHIRETKMEYTWFVAYCITRRIRTKEIPIPNVIKRENDNKMDGSLLALKNEQFCTVKLVQSYKRCGSHSAILQISVHACVHVYTTNGISIFFLEKQTAEEIIHFRTLSFKATLNMRKTLKN